ncbi:MAG: YjbQ family protein [Deltaproteobacteria bacterium]|jgi:secondary thiamine-phosphate synthase enzyme|nr:YjbQ family protein [Deltaproteobacteria bacterium]MBW2531294.1 YjbQ family protein [Deltaproteobacteria bacterium]
MIAHQAEIVVRTAPGAFHDITGDVARIVADSSVRTGLVTVFVRHTSASLVIQENADPSVRRDLEHWLAELAPIARGWEHGAEGPDDMPAHAKAALTSTSESIPVTAGRLALGTWQALYLWEHRARPHRRTVVVHVAGI